jgi:hypothetical protein
MREFVFSATVARMSRAPLVLTLLAGCISPAYEQYLQHGDGAGAESSSSGDANADETTASTGDAAPTSSSSADGTGASAADTTDATTSSSTTSTATTGSAEDPSVGDAEKPEIVDVMLPAEVYAAGPVSITVETVHAGAVLVQLDGVDAGELVAVGDGTFTGELPVHGAVDNGVHAVEVIATQGELAAHRTAHYNVKTPMPGTEAWSQAGPEGSRTNRVAVTPEGDLIEVGQTEIDGVAHPTIRKRSGVTGEELWPEGTITLDTREGAVVDVAVLPDGRMWVAMNVREPMKDPRPRFTLLDTDGHATSVDILGTSGRVVRGIAVDADGGCFAVGVAGVQGDWDFAYWRIDPEGVQTLGDVYDYKPGAEAHKFRDIASDVQIVGDLAWVVGSSQGPYDNEPARIRGVLVPMDLHAGGPVAPVIVAPKDGGWSQSVFFGGALHPEGVLTTGYGCDDTCGLYRIETSLYTAAGERLWHATESPNAALVYGNDVALDGQGRALVAGAVTQNGKIHGYSFGRVVGQDGLQVFEHEYSGLGPSEALGVARDAFDRIFLAGYVTINGELQAQLTRIHG